MYIYRLSPLTASINFPNEFIHNNSLVSRLRSGVEVARNLMRTNEPRQVNVGFNQCTRSLIYYCTEKNADFRKCWDFMLFESTEEHVFENIGITCFRKSLRYRLSKVLRFHAFENKEISCFRK